MDLEQYWEKLNNFDWFYEYSDDHSVWQRGRIAASKIAAIAIESPEHRALYDGFYKHHFSGKSFGTEKAPKPEKPRVYIDVYVYPDNEQYHEPPFWKSDDYEKRKTTSCERCDEEMNIHYGEPFASCNCGTSEWYK